MERELEELQIEKDTKEKKSSDLQITILKLETEVDVMGVRSSYRESVKADKATLNRAVPL